MPSEWSSVVPVVLSMNLLFGQKQQQGTQRKRANYETFSLVAGVIHYRLAAEINPCPVVHKPAFIIARHGINTGLHTPNLTLNSSMDTRFILTGEQPRVPGSLAVLVVGHAIFWIHRFFTNQQ